MKFGKVITFEVDQDLLEYDIKEEIQIIADMFDEILEKSNDVAVFDLFEDMYHSLNRPQLMAKWATDERITKFKCLRCNHKWIPRTPNEKSRLCPKCKSPYWDRPRKKKVKK